MALPAICVDSTDDSPAAWPVLKFQQNTPMAVQVQLLTAAGTPYVLDDTTDTVKVTVLESPSVRDLLFQLNGVVTDDVNGILTFTALADTCVNAGVANGEITIRRSNVVLKRIRCMAEVEISLEDYADRHNNPLTISEVRAATRDRSFHDNPLIQKVEFSDAEIIWSIIRTVERFNEYGDARQSYTCATFPHRTIWMEGSLGELFKIAALNLTRNRMPVQSGGVQMDDSTRADLYLKLSEQYLERFQTMAIGIKRGNSWAAWTGTVRSSRF